MPLILEPRPDLLPQTDTLTEEKSIVDILSAFDIPLTCDMPGCERVAAGWLVCGACYIGRETQCAEHRKECLEKAEALGRDNDYSWTIRFNGTCDHKPEYLNCLWEPINR